MPKNSKKTQCSVAFGREHLSGEVSAESDIPWAGSIEAIDHALCRKYGLTKSEIDFIGSMIRPMK